AVRASLRGHRELDAAGVAAFDRQPDANLLAVSLLLAEELVLVRDALRKLRRPELDRGRLGGEAEPVAVQVIAVRDGVAHLDGRGVESARGELERLVRIEQAVGVQLGRGVRDRREKKQREKRQREERELAQHHVVSAATQSRYAGSPAASGSAMISGSSYGWCSRTAASSAA